MNRQNLNGLSLRTAVLAALLHVAVFPGIYKWMLTLAGWVCDAGECARLRFRVRVIREVKNLTDPGESGYAVMLWIGPAGSRHE